MLWVFACLNFWDEGSGLRLGREHMFPFTRFAFLCTPVAEQPLHDMSYVVSSSGCSSAPFHSHDR